MAGRKQKSQAGRLRIVAGNWRSRLLEIADVPGLYFMGLPLMRRRKSTFIFGVEDDANDITHHLLGYLSASDQEHSDGLYRNHGSEPRYRRSA